MGEISIDPKFNIHETYKKVRILNPYRNSGAPSGTNDADAANYLAAVGIINDATVYYAGTPQEITGAAIYTAMNNFVGTLKSEGVYAKLKAVYPLIGGNAGNHKWNLINPQDTNAAHRLNFYGTFTHSATGIKGDGVAGTYQDTNFNHLINSELNNESFGVYSRTDRNELEYDIGIQYLGQDSVLLIRYSNKFYTRSQDNSWDTPANTNSKGFFSVSRLESTKYKKYKNTTYSEVFSSSTSLVDRNFFVSAVNFEGDNAYNSAREYSYSFIGEGLTETQMTAHYNAVQQLQTDLKRAV